MYLKNWNQKANVGRIGRASSDDARILGDPGALLSRKNFEIRGLQTAGNALKRSILPLTRYFI